MTIIVHRMDKDYVLSWEDEDERMPIFRMVNGKLIRSLFAVDKNFDTFVIYDWPNNPWISIQQYYKGGAVRDWWRR